jgi:hypothetical protein
MIGFLNKMGVAIAAHQEGAGWRQQEKTENRIEAGPC